MKIRTGFRGDKRRNRSLDLDVSDDDNYDMELSTKKNHMIQVLDVEIPQNYGGVQVLNFDGSPAEVNV